MPKPRAAAPAPRRSSACGGGNAWQLARFGGAQRKQQPINRQADKSANHRLRETSIVVRWKVRAEYCGHQSDCCPDHKSNCIAGPGLASQANDIAVHHPLIIRAPEIVEL